MSVSLRRFFESQPQCVITHFFTDGRSPVRDITACRPHLVIMQTAIVPEAKRRELQRRFPNTIIASWVDSRIDQARMTGLLEAARAKTVIEFEVNRAHEKPGTFTQHQSPGNHRLTNKERQVLQLLADGNSYLAVCEELLIGYETLRTHVQHIYAKLGVKRVNEAVAMARREKLVK